MSFEFEIKQKTKIKVSIYGSEYDLVKPTVSQAKEMSKFADEKDQSKAIEATIDFMELMGLPKEVSSTMEIEHFTQLVEFIVGKVKKN